MDNARKYNIKVVNLSIGTNDRKVNLPLKEAVERLWQMGIVVVAAARKSGWTQWLPSATCGKRRCDFRRLHGRIEAISSRLRFRFFQGNGIHCPIFGHREMISFRCFRPILISPCPTAAVKTSWTEIISP